MKKAIVLIFILSNIYSCRKDGKFLYEVIDFELKNANNSADAPFISNSFGISKKSYAIGVKYTMQHKGQINGGGNIRETGYINEYEVESFKIFSIDSYDSLHPAGADISDYFLYTNNSFYNSNKTISYLINNDDIGDGNYGKDEETWNSEQFLIMMTEPKNNGTFRFKVEIKQSNGMTLSDITSIILTQ